CSGTVDRFHGRLQLTHPDYQVLEAGQGEDPALGVGARARLGEGPIPVYTVTKGLSAMQVSQAVGLALHAVGELPDPIPARVRLAHGLPALAEAYRMVHEPRDDAE